ncbi:HK97-gp10 family putative phage morphogenesis protein [Neobacillus sp. PS3-40]|uniref:HK97-gp10 family putative phage morphogenesis protein n=1 Tax=Neobacillus sp. PS3-40 TaxID=3070679 RepID=UPI0027DECC4B|nr:HK97-gp10 family putative phage morphogenesis protein [Neobacillus sp. PS3-40]WML44087.1 HK97 gp10 family phage protein [Neobacillus sp. PS3-40]
MSRFQDAIEDMKRKRQQTLEEIATFVEAEAKQRAPVLTGDLRRKITHVTEHTDDVSRAKVGTNLEYAQAVEEGSKPHKIHGKDGKPLRFKIDGHWVTVDEVNHPGTKAQPFLIPAITENTGEIQARIQRGMSVND